MSHSEAQKKLMLASFAVGQAQRDLEDAQARFQEALAHLEALEATALMPDFSTAKQCEG